MSRNIHTGGDAEQRLHMELANVRKQLAALERIARSLGAGGGGGGVTDHGLLTGLSDDDHSIYALADGSRGSFVKTDLSNVPAGLATQAELDAVAAAKQAADADLTTIASIDSGTSAGVMATEASGWVKRTYAQVKTSLGLTKSDVGLGSVDNTADAAKPVSTAQQTALDLKANLASPTFTGTVVVPLAVGATSPYQKSEVDTLLAAKATAADLTAHIGDTSAAHAGSAVSVNPSGLIVVTGTDVQAAIGQLDAAVAAGGIPSTIGDAKGDLVGFSADNTPVRIPAAASNGCVITSATSQTGGVKWREGYVPLHARSGRGNPASTNGFLLVPSSTGSIVGDTAAASLMGTFYLDPATYGGTSVSVKLRIAVWTETSPTSSTLTGRVIRVTSASAGALTGSSVVGASTTIASLTGANTAFVSALSSAVTISTAGWHAVQFFHSVNPAQTMNYQYELVVMPL